MLSSRGFTLLEVAIVLVIVALLVAGILVGRDLILAAEVRKEIANLAAYETAYHAFRGKYNAVPGDATESQTGGLPNVDPTHYCNGNSIVEMGDPHEGLRAWEHLAATGLLAGSYDGTITPPFACLPVQSCPPTPFNNLTVHVLVGLNSLLAGNGPDFLYGNRLAASDENVSIFIVSGESYWGSADIGIRTAEAHALDAKLDDAVASTGRFIAMNLPGLATDGCVDGDIIRSDPSRTHNYDLTSDATNCGAIYVLR